MQFGQINYFAVLVGTVFNMVLGFLWYGPFFGKPWLGMMEKMGKRREDMRGTPSIYFVTLVGAFVLSLAIALIVKAFAVDSWWMGLAAGAVIWIGVGATGSLTSSVFEGRPTGLWVLNNLYQLVVSAGLGVLYVVWK